MEIKLNIMGIYIGNIYERVSKNESILYKENVILLKINDHSFVPLESLKSYLVYLSVCKLVIDKNFILCDYILTDVYNPRVELKYYIDNNSLALVDTNISIENIEYDEIKNLRKTFVKKRVKN